MLYKAQAKNWSLPRWPVIHHSFSFQPVSVYGSAICLLNLLYWISSLVLKHGMGWKQCARGWALQKSPLVEQNCPGPGCLAFTVALHHSGSWEAGVRSRPVPEHVYPWNHLSPKGQGFPCLWERCALTLPLTGKWWAKRGAWYQSPLRRQEMK